MSGESFGNDQSKTTTNPGWDELKNTEFNGGAQNTEQQNPDINTSQNTEQQNPDTNTNLVEGFLSTRYNQEANKINSLDDSINALRQSQANATADYENAETNRVASEQNVSNLIGNKEQIKNEIQELKSEHSAGNYIKTQSEQVGTILKANVGVVKSGLGLFVRKIIAKIPKIEISVKNAEQVANQNWQDQMHENSVERQAAQAKVNSVEQAQEAYEQAKEGRQETVDTFKENRDDRKEAVENIKGKKIELKDKKSEISDAKQEYELVKQEYESTKTDYESAQKEYNKANNKRNALAKKLESTEERLNRAKEHRERKEAMSEIQKELNNKNPASLREGLQNKLQKAQDTYDDKLQELLFLKGVDSIYDLGDEDNKRLDKTLSRQSNQISIIEEQLNLIDKYESLQEQTNKLSRNSTVKQGIKNFIENMQARTAPAPVAA